MSASALEPVRGSIVVADDDDAIRVSLAEVLELEGWRVVEARDGLEALEQILTTHPDVALLDHRMPGLTGAEVYRRACAGGQPVHVILVTADHSAPRLAAEAGIEHYLEKPFHLTDLLDLIDRATR